MVDSARLGAVVDECTAWASELVVEGDRGGEATEAREDAFAEALEGPGAVAFEGKDVFGGPEDRFVGHRDGTVTRTVYVREIADARRRAMRRSRMAEEFSGALRAALDSQAD